METRTYQKTEHAPDPVWMEFTATNLPDAVSYWISDVDSIIRDRKGNMMLLELKYNSRDVSPQQRATLLLIDKLIRAGLASIDGPVDVPGLKYPLNVNYEGVHLLQVSGNDFESSTLTWDRKQISKKELIAKLSFKETKK